jgi:hypothetical protein
LLLHAIDAVPIWQEMEAELAPLLIGRWMQALRPGDHLLFSSIDSAVAAGLQVFAPSAAVTDLS